MATGVTMPGWVQPMAATLTKERFTHPDWIFERKFDGIRILAFKQGRDVKLYSRNHLLQNEAYPRIAAAVAQLPWQQAILDGEASWRSQQAADYQIFDVLWAERDVRLLPLGLGALLIGFHDGADFVYAGKVGTGLDNAMLHAMRARLDRIEIERPPFTRASGLPRVRAHWVRPEVAVRVAFIEWTVHKKLRQPRLISVAAAM